MISFIKGKLISMTAQGVVVENQGVGYGIMMPMGAGYLPKIGQDIVVYTHMHVREDDISLFGFLTPEERDTFELLIGVSGIGPKVGLAILSTLSVYELKLAVMSEDVKTISSTPGLGPKGAKKLILEMKDKLDFASMDEELGEMASGTDNPADALVMTVEGLVSLGYSKSEATMAVSKVDGASEMEPEELLKKALKKIMI